MASLTRASMEAGAAGVMIAPPPSLRTDDQIVTYFKQAVEAIGALATRCPGLALTGSAVRHDPRRMDRYERVEVHLG